jgi:hypothetical protein
VGGGGSRGRGERTPVVLRDTERYEFYHSKKDTIYIL